MLHSSYRLPCIQLCGSIIPYKLLLPLPNLTLLQHDIINSFLILQFYFLQIISRLDKKKFFVHGAGIFSALTGALFPLTVVKTRMMALDGAPTGLSGAVITAREVVRHDGFRGLYKGFGTVLFGAIPARILYLGTLESTKSALATALHHHSDLPEPAIASSASFVAGGAASLAGQLVVVPIDVVSQRLMIMGGNPAGAAGVSAAAAAGATAAAASPAPTAAAVASMAQAGRRRSRPNGWTLAQRIVQQEGVLGLYRGFGASVATFVPSNAIWWASYGGWQAFLWEQYDRALGTSPSSTSTSSSSRARLEGRSESEILGVQIIAGVLTGCTSASLTTPLDVVKTRLQTRETTPGEGIKPTWRNTASGLLKTEGMAGFFRGVAPRMVSSSIWGTAMVTTYEFLKRLCMLPPEEVI